MMPDRLTRIPAALRTRTAAHQGAVHQRIGQLRQEVADAKKALANLHRGIESGIIDPTESSLQARVQKVRANCDLAQAALDRAKELARGLIDGEAESRKAWLSAIVDEPGKIRVMGKSDNFERNLGSHKACRGPLHSSDRKWWGKQDSNLRRHSQRIYSPPPLPLGTFPRLRP